MLCVYVFTFWSLLPLYDKALEPIVFYVSGGILQLVLLPLIMVGSNILSRAAEERAAQDHETLMKEFAELKEIHRLILARTAAVDLGEQ